MQSHYEPGIVLYGPESFLFFGLQVCQDNDYSMCIQDDEQLTDQNCYPLSKQQRKQGNEPFIAIETSSFRPVNSSLGWTGVAASSFCSFYTCFLRQKAPSATVYDLIR